MYNSSTTTLFKSLEQPFIENCCKGIFAEKKILKKEWERINVTKGEGGVEKTKIWLFHLIYAEKKENQVMLKGLL